MRLSTILKDRLSINILKVMHINEYVEKASHTMTYSQLRKKIGVTNGIESLKNLADAGLIAKESVEEELVLSMTTKGRKFLEQFDRLVLVYNNVVEKAPSFKVEYDLTELEKRILLGCYTLRVENRKEISLRALASEVYPHKDPIKSKSALSRRIKKLEEYNLLKKIIKSNQVYLDTTTIGERIAKEQILNEKSLQPVEAGVGV